MKKRFIVAPLVCLLGSFVYAKDANLPEKGTLTEMEAVACGSEEKSGDAGLKAAVIGSDSNHKKERPLLCQEYVLQSGLLRYRIRVKDEKHAVLLPVGEGAEFRLKKDYMLLRVPEMDSKVRQYFVMSMTPREHKEPEKTAAKAER